MAEPRRIRQLRSRLKALNRHLLPKPSTTGSYTPRQYDATRGFRVLAHAEIEACLEALAKQTLDGAYRGWTTDGKGRNALLALLAYHAGTLSIKPPRKSLPEKIMSAQKWYHGVIDANHGIKEKNVLSILLPIGIAESDIDNTWLATLNSFGRARGGTAHTSAAATNQPDPVNEWMTVEQIVAGLAVIAGKLRRLEK